MGPREDPLLLSIQKVKMIGVRVRVSPLGKIRASTVIKLKASTKPRIREPAHMRGTKGRAARTISLGKEKVRRDVSSTVISKDAGSTQALLGG